MKQASGNEIVYEITNTVELNIIVEKFKNGENISIGIKGASFCNTPMKFDVEVYVSFILTVNLTK